MLKLSLPAPAITAPHKSGAGVPLCVQLLDSAGLTNSAAQGVVSMLRSTYLFLV